MESKPGIGVSVGLLLLRAGATGLLFFGHGWAKLGHFAEYAPSFPDPLGVGSTSSLVLVVLAEVICAAAVLLGFLTRLALVALILFFAVALFIHHAHDPWSKKELAAVYIVPMIALFFTGPGRYSLDALLARRGARSRG